jgi:hypothetical protein
VIPIPIRRVLSTIRRFDVPALLMGGQACVLYGAAEFSRDVDLAVLATPEALPRLRAAIDDLAARVIAVPPFEARWLLGGHAVHFEVPGGDDPPLRVDVMSRMRGVDPFDLLWARRTTIMLPTDGEELPVEVMALPDLVQAKKTQRDKDWPMLRRLVDASYAAERDVRTPALVAFWLAELRSPEFLRELVALEPEAAAMHGRPAVRAALVDGDLAGALAAEQAEEVAADRAYWQPLRRELERLRHAARPPRPDAS